jgi:hypothetical protein
VVEPKHINGGFTYVYESEQNNTIHIFIVRREEFPKVMLHETLHHSFIDQHTNIHNNPALRDIVATLKKLCNIHPSTLFLPNEAIVETMAIIMHSLCISIEYNIDARTVIDKEIQWGHVQAHRVLEYQKHLNDGLWRETSNAYCYIVIKAILLDDYNGFLHAIENANTNATTTNNTHTTTLFDYMLEKVAMYFNHINNFTGNKNKVHNRSFRMSVFGDL